MAAANDKARQHLERSVPDLRELERKKVFSKEEILSIVKKRTEFELVVNSPGPSVADYSRYLEYEFMLETLKKKRVARLAIRLKNGHSGQVRLFAIFERATRKFPGNVALWIQYIDYCRRVGAHKKVDHALTKMLRLHPTNQELWLYAARYELDSNGSVSGARQYLHRGLRFCQKSQTVWVEYGKLEMVFIAKLESRRRLFRQHQNSRVQPVLVKPLSSGSGEDKALLDNDDVVALPSTTADELVRINRSDNEDSDDEDSTEKEALGMPTISEEELNELENSPLLSGAIPITVFDQAMAKFENDALLADRFFSVYAEFDVDCGRKVLQHVVSAIESSTTSSRSSTESSLIAAICAVRLSLLRVDCSSPEFPALLADGLACANRLMASHRDRTVFVAERMAQTLVPLLSQFKLSSSEDETDSPIDPAIRTVILASLKRYALILQQSGQSGPGGTATELSSEQKYASKITKMIVSIEQPFLLDATAE